MIGESEISVSRPFYYLMEIGADPTKLYGVYLEIFDHDHSRSVDDVMLGMLDLTEYETVLDPYYCG